MFSTACNYTSYWSTPTLVLPFSHVGLRTHTIDNLPLSCEQKEPQTEQKSQFTMCKPWMRKEIYKDTNQVHPQTISMQFLRYCSLFLTFGKCDWRDSSILMENVHEFVCRLTKRIDTTKPLYIRQFACTSMTTGPLWWVEGGICLHWE